MSDLKDITMVTTRDVLAYITAGVSKLKENPMAVVAHGDRVPVSITQAQRNELVFYAVSAAAFEQRMDKLEDMELATLVAIRRNQPKVKVSIKPG